MIFASKNNPRGPNVRALEVKRFDISGANIQISIPSGNCRQIPSPDGKFLERINIYSPPSEDTYDLGLCSMTTIGTRMYDFNGFMGSSVGSLKLHINIYRIHDKNINLFSPDIMRDYLSSHIVSRCANFNEKIIEDWLKLKWDNKLEIEDINRIRFVRYLMVKQGKPNIHYATPLFDDCYLEIIMEYSSIQDEQAPWIDIAHDLQRRILHSVQIKLTDSSTTNQANKITT